MFLEHVRVQNFRNLRDISVWLQPGFNMLVGRNNTGKSNLFLAIRHALGPIAARADWLPPLSRDDIYHDGTRHVPEPIRIELTFADLTQRQQALFFEILDYNPDEPDSSRARIFFEVAWDTERTRFHRPKRWGVEAEADSEVPYETIRALPITFLPALRDAEHALSPGRSSRLALLLEDLARTSQHSSHSDEIREIFELANANLEEHPLIEDAVGRLREATESMAGSDYVESSVRASNADFGKIVRSLRILIDDNPADLSASGLGYNNLLFIATVLSHLRQPEPDEVPLLLIEEPEAHLHPQLAQRLGAFLSGALPGQVEQPPQTIVATHSPTLASQARPTQVSALFQRGSAGRGSRCNSLSRIGLHQTEERSLARMLDITRASIFFAKGLLLVEGVSEELLIPALARTLGIDLSHDHVSVVPLCGVNFATLARVLGPDGLDIPVAIISDGDPPVDQTAGWETAVPRIQGGGFVRSPRAAALQEQFEDHPSIRVFLSDVTLEYDLAAANTTNAQVMSEVWVGGHPGAHTLTPDKVEEAADKALIVWRGVCRANPSWSKADFAHLLAEHITSDEAGAFSVPGYIENAIRYVVDALAKREGRSKADEDVAP